MDVADVVDYKEAYLCLMRSVERAERILIDAQRQCEELIIRDQDEEEDRT